MSNDLDIADLYEKLSLQTALWFPPQLSHFQFAFEQLPEQFAISHFVRSLALELQFLVIWPFLLQAKHL